MISENARLRDELDEALDKLEELEAALREACTGGTKRTPLGFEQRLNKIEDDLGELESGGKLRQMLGFWDLTAERNTPTRLALLEARAAINSRVLWTLGSAVGLAIVSAIMGVLLNK
ncbi:MAG: hypothetical protein VX930_06475 [Pseudomonadota bacterium]|nr:hypothetical protein [Pseudomonadota bacterium]